GAPDDVPAPNALVGLPWTVCRSPGPTGQPVTWAVLGHAVAGGRTLGDGVLVSDPQGRRALIWQAHRLALPAGTATLIALDWTGMAALPVPPEFVDAVPAGPDLAAPQVPQAGQPGPTVAGQ